MYDKIMNALVNIGLIAILVGLIVATVHDVEEIQQALNKSQLHQVDKK